MRRLLLLSLLSISLHAAGQRRYAAYIDTPRGTVSGICAMAADSVETHGVLFNEFGITALEFSWHRAKDKVRLHQLLPALDRWYIRRTLRRDLRHLLHRLQQGDSTYVNRRRHITYTLTPLTSVSQ